MNAFGTTLFDKFGRIKPHIVTKGYRSGTGCWAEELNEGQIIYLTHIDVTEKVWGSSFCRGHFIFILFDSTSGKG